MMPPLLILKARAEAQAVLFVAAEYETLGEALTPLLVYAHDNELEEQLGYEGVLEVIRAAFKTVGIEIGGETI